jgi:dGTPase
MNAAWTERRSGVSNQRPNDHRDPYQRDRARILHSAAFRRLQAKTQILSVGEDDFYRTRLTHSLEVAQIGTGLIAQLKQSGQVLKDKALAALLPSDALMESLCLAHDIGHPPFGHGGEVALNYLMHGTGGFEANGQTLRIVASIEPYTETYGMDLTRRSLLGLIKYPQFIRTNSQFKVTSNSTTNSVPQTEFINTHLWKPTKGLLGTEKKVLDWTLSELNAQDQKLFSESESLDPKSEAPFIRTKTKYKSFDASIMELADDIAYAVHDLEDAIVLNNVNAQQWRHHVLDKLLKIDNPWAQKHATQLSKMLFSEKHYERKNAIGALVNHLITSIEITVTNDAFTELLCRYNATLNSQALPLLELLKSFVFEYVIKTTKIQQLEFKGQQMLIKLFHAFYSDPQRLLPKTLLTEFESLTSEHQIKRFICDYLANMSDDQAKRTYDTMFTTSV